MESCTFLGTNFQNHRWPLVSKIWKPSKNHKKQWSGGWKSLNGDGWMTPKPLKNHRVQWSVIKKVVNGDGQRGAKPSKNHWCQWFSREKTIVSHRSQKMTIVHIYIYVSNHIIICPQVLSFNKQKQKSGEHFVNYIVNRACITLYKLTPKINPKWKSSKNKGKGIWRTQGQVALVVQGQVAMVVEMALRAYPTVHWLSGGLNSGFECIKRISPQQTHIQLLEKYTFLQRIFAETG